MGEGLTPEMRTFLEKLAPHHKPQTRGVVGCVTSRTAGRARIACRRFGYAKYVKRRDGKAGWRITPLGRRMLSEAPLSTTRDDAADQRRET